MLLRTRVSQVMSGPWVILIYRLPDSRTWVVSTAFRTGEELAGALCRLFRKPLENSPQASLYSAAAADFPTISRAMQDHTTGRPEREGVTPRYQPQNGRSTGLVASARLR